MVHGYHIIFGAYGFWLPNDPRGSWSSFVGEWELVRFGRTSRSLERKTLTPAEDRLRRQAKMALKYPAVAFNDQQIEIIAEGFATLAKRCRIEVWGCSILPEHVHCVVARHKMSAETMTKLFKGEATKQLKAHDLHPLQRFATKRGLPCPWARGQWICYLDTDDYICSAIDYAEQNPEKEGRPRQRWPFVTPYRGLEPGLVVYG